MCTDRQRVSLIVHRSKSVCDCTSVDNVRRQHTTVTATLMSLGATEMMKTLKVTGLLQLLAAGNHTVFAPTNEAFASFVPQAV